MSDNTPQFTTAEYSGPAGDRCAVCQQPVTAYYYRVNGKMACASCAERLQRELPQDSHTAFVRGLIFGIGAAIIGLVFYAGFTIVTGLYIGYVSLAVGWLIGKAMMLGSKGKGGRRYQISAVALTYAAVSLAAIPIAIHYQIKARNEGSAIESKQLSSPDGKTAQPEQGKPDSSSPKMSFGAALAQLLLIGLASPFLELQDPVHGVIGLVILLVGLRIAWKITQGSRTVDVQGPYDNSASASSMR
jgi:hypothetical protein